MDIYINDLLGAPYKDHGRDINGYDCYGLAIEVCRRYGYKLDDVFYNNHDIALSNEYKPTLNCYPVLNPSAGVVIEMEHEGNLHIGVCINSKEFIHMTKQGCRVSHIGAIKIRGFYGISTRI